VDLCGRVGRGFRGIEAVDLEELPAVGIEQGQDDLSVILVGHRMDIVTGSNSEIQPLAGGCRSGGYRGVDWPVRGGHSLLLATAAEAEKQEQD